MRHIRQIINTAAILFVLTTCATLAHAQTAQRTFVSTQGNDSNTASLCGRNAPCRSFTAAISVVTAGGEVVVLDSGGYGTVTITKAVQIISPSGVYAGITVSSGDGVTVNAPGATVVLRGLSINRQGTGANGVNVDAVGTLHVEGCTINGFANAGIVFDVAGKLFVKDSIIRSNGFGIIFDTSSGTIEASLDRLRVEGNSSGGLRVNNGAQVALRHSVVADNDAFGISVNPNVSGATASLHIEDCLSTNSGTNGISVNPQNGATADVSIARSAFVKNAVHGITVFGSSGNVAAVTVDDSRTIDNTSSGIIAGGGSGVVVRVSNTTITRNNTGVGFGGSASVRSFGDNKLSGNRMSDGSFTAPVITKQ